MVVSTKTRRGSDPTAPAREDVLHGWLVRVRREHVQAVARLDDGAPTRRDRVVPPDHHGDNRCPWQSELTNGRSGDRVIGCYEEVDEVELAQRAHLERRLMGLRRRNDEVEPARNALERRSLQGHR